MVGIRPVGIRTLRSFSKNLQFVALYHIFTKSFYFKIKHRSSDERVEADSEGKTSRPKMSIKVSWWFL